MSKFRLIQVMAVAAMALCTASCSNEDIGLRPLPSPDADNAAASTQYYDCMRAAARKLDDGKVDADLVVSRVADACSSAYAELKATLSMHVSGEARAKFESDMDANRLSGVRDFVRHERSTQSASSNPG